jgi:PadR family transcriptional regulator PadR
MLKGLLEGCILEIISHGETYGYEITSKLNNNGFSELNEGSVYPVLMRLSKKEFVSTETKVSKLGPKRKYFKITELGQEFLLDFRRDWFDIEGAVNSFMKGENDE